MNRWYVAALTVIAGMIALFVSLPESCDDFFGCDGLRVAPIVPLFLGVFLAGLFSFLGFMRNTK